MNAVKLRSLYDMNAEMTKFFGPGVERITPMEHDVSIVFETMEQAQTSRDRLHVGKPPIRSSREAGDFYVESAGPVKADARAYSHHDPGPGFAVKGVWQAQLGAIFTSPDQSLGSSGTNEFSFTKDNYRATRHYDIIPMGFWTWAYRLELDKAAEAYLKEHGSKPTIAGEADDEFGRLVEPKPLESFQ